MQKDSIKKLSVLGLVLMAASAVTAAIIPSKGNNDSKERVAGQLQPSTGGTGGNTCINAGSGVDCDYTATGNGAGLSSTSATNLSPAEANDDHSTTINNGEETETGTTLLR